MAEDYLVRHCAPTLAGLKTGSLFLCPYCHMDELMHALRRINRRLRSKGLLVLPLRISGEKALIYAYRPRKLRQDFSKDDAAELLRQFGYDPANCAQCVARLGRRIRQHRDFPHEIGLFLGYPVEDVRGFINQGPCGCKCTGCWKVYGDEAAARKTFACYKKCTRVYCSQWAKTGDIDRLTVAV